MALSVLGRRVIVPGKPIWCEELPGRTVGAIRAFPRWAVTLLAMALPISASTVIGKCVPCCSNEPTAKTAVLYPADIRSDTSGQLKYSISISGLYDSTCSLLPVALSERLNCRPRGPLLQVGAPRQRVEAARLLREGGDALLLPKCAE